MEQIYYRDLLNSVKDERNRKILYYTQKQITRGNFHIKEDRCEVIAFYDNVKYLVILTDDISIKEFSNNLVWIYGEPSDNFLKDHLYHRDGSLFAELSNYQQSNCKPGRDYKKKYYFKIYSKEKIENSLRELYNSGWIDYEKQLEKGNEIYDEIGVAGLFAMTFDIFMCSFNESSRSNYGNRLFLVKLLDDVNYFFNNKEIIGSRFEVIEKYDLGTAKIEEIGKLVKRLIEMKEAEHKNLIIQKDNRIEKLYCDNYEMKTEFSKEIKRGIQTSWLCLILGVIFGIIIGMIITMILASK